MCVCHLLTSRDRTKIIQTLSDAFGHLAPGRFHFLARISVFTEYVFLQSIPNIRPSSIVTTRASDGLVCRHDEALLQRRTWSRAATADSFGPLSSRSTLSSPLSGSTRKTPSTLALPPSEGPQSMHAALSKRAGMYFASFLRPSKSQPFPQGRKLYELKIVLPLLQDPIPCHVGHLGDGPLRHMQL